MTLLDVGCAKVLCCMTLEDIPGILIKGVDVSNYAIKNSMTSVKYLEVANAKVCHLKILVLTLFYQ